MTRSSLNNCHYAAHNSQYQPVNEKVNWYVDTFNCFPAGQAEDERSGHCWL